MRKSLHTQQNQIFLALLKDLRVARKLRQSDVGRLVGIAQATVSKVERGERRLDVIELREWLSALDANFLEFMTKLDDRVAAAFTTTPFNSPTSKRQKGT